MLNAEQSNTFKIICKKFIPEYILHICDSNNIFDVAFSGNKNRDLFYSLYNLGDDDLNFVFSRLHFALNEWFDNINYRLKRNNRYITSGSRSELVNLHIAIKEIIAFLSKNGIACKLNLEYAKRIKYLVELIQNNNEDSLPNDFQAFDTIIDESIFNVSKRGIFEKPKYLIFGISQDKPDIRIKNVIDGNLEIVNSDDMIIYDEEIKESLTYRDFNNWWLKNRYKYGWYKLENQLNPRELKVQNFYKSRYASNENNPVLIPQVYLHYDPKCKKEREKYMLSDTIIFQRMDFLILYNNRRIIIEIDGSSHFETNNTVDLVKYTKQVEYDRTMKFLGYDSYNYEGILEVFFNNLYKYLDIIK